MRGATVPETRPRVIVTWPRYGRHGWGLRIVDADTGRDYSPVTIAAAVTVDPKGGIHLDALMITDEDGNPQANEGPTILIEDGNGYRKAGFMFAIVEMRVEPEPDNA